MLVFFSENKPVSLLSGFPLHIPAHMKLTGPNSLFTYNKHQTRMGTD